MDQPTEDASWTLIGLLMPSNIIIRCISFACLGLGLISFLPFTFLIVLDFFLWIWRTSWSRFSNDDAPPNHVRADAAVSTVRSKNDVYKDPLQSHIE